MVDWVSIIIAALALFVAILNYVQYKKLQKENNDLSKQSNLLQEKYNKLAEVQTLTAQGALETQVRMAISDAYQQVADMSVKLQTEPGNENLQKLYRGAEEIYRNAYEDACAKYLDKKMDKDRFKTMYLSDIR